MLEHFIGESKGQLLFIMRSKRYFNQLFDIRSFSNQSCFPLVNLELVLKRSSFDPCIEVLSYILIAYNTFNSSPSTQKNQSYSNIYSFKTNDFAYKIKFKRLILIGLTVRLRQRLYCKLTKQTKLKSSQFYEDLSENGPF